MSMAWKAAAAALIFASFAAGAHEYKQGTLTIVHPWARPTAAGQPGAAYFTIKNAGSEADTLESASTPAAAMTHVHENKVDANGVMHMEPVEGGLSIPAGGTVELKPGGYHVMLMGLERKLEEGEHILLKLTFAHAGSVDVEVHVEKKPGNEGENVMHSH
jgi:periplasmic copper chaperone A